MAWSFRLLVASALIAIGLSALGSPSPAQQVVFTVGSLHFVAPAGWTPETPSSAMRAVELRLPTREGRPQGIAVFYRFPPGKGGTPEQTITRWYGAFADPPASLRADLQRTHRGETEIILFRGQGNIRGRDTTGRPAILPDYGLLAAMLSGINETVFIRLALPAKNLDHIGKNFEDLVFSPFTD